VPRRLKHLALRPRGTEASLRGQLQHLPLRPPRGAEASRRGQLRHLALRPPRVAKTPQPGQLQHLSPQRLRDALELRMGLL